MMIKSPKSLIAQFLPKAAIAICLALTLITGHAFAQGENGAIVKIVSTINGQGYEGVGFAWQPTGAGSVYFVTPLHLVAGSSAITILSPNNVKHADAAIHKFYRQADLALLAPLQQVNIPALLVYSRLDMPRSGILWSLPGQRAIQTNMKMGKRKQLYTLFKRNKTVPTPQAASKHFDPHFYPDVNFTVLPLKKWIGAGYSGSPIMKGNQVVSMVDGGLHRIGIKKAWWSIPLKKNLDLLWEQGDTDASTVAPYTANGGRILFSKPISQNMRVQYKQIKPGAGASDITLNYTDRLGFRDVYESMFPEDQAFIAEVVDDDDRIGIDALFDEEIDVYECDNTGATFAIPTMLSDDLILESDGGLTYVEAFSQFSDNSGAYVKLIVMIGTGGKVDKEDFRDYILSGDALDDGDEWGNEEWSSVDWVEEDDESDDAIIDDLDDPDDPYYFEIMERIYERFDEDDELIDDGELYASMTINEEGVFLGVAIIVNDPSGLSVTDLVSYYLMEACITMAGFPY